MSSPPPQRPPAGGAEDAKPKAPFAVAIGHTRYVVLLGVVAVLLLSAALFLLGAVQTLVSIWRALQGTVQGGVDIASLTVDFLEIVSTMLKAVVFYLIGVGFYSLFIAPLNLPVALGVETLYDLESKIVSVIVVIMAITFLEHLIQWQQPAETLQFAIGVAVVTAALVFFQFHAHQAREELTKNSPAIEERAQVELFSEGKERRDIKREEYRDALDPPGQSDRRETNADQPPRGQ